MCLIALLPLHFRFLRQQTPVVLAARSRFSSTLRLNTSAFDHDAVLESQRRNHKPMPLTVNRNAVKRNARFSNTSIDFTCHKLGRLFLHVCRYSSNYHFAFDTHLIFINYWLRYRRCRQMKKKVSASLSEEYPIYHAKVTNCDDRFYLDLQSMR